MPEKVVSVIIPVLNGGRWIREAVESCLNQSWSKIEVIVVDNGSTDGSLQTVRAIGAANLVTAECVTRGASAARNLGIRLARGDFFQFLDADDVLHREKIAEQMRRLERGQRDAIASGAWARFRNAIADATFFREDVWRDLSPVEFLVSSWLNSGGMMPVFAWLTPRSLIEQAGPWDESLSLNDDGEYFTRVVLRSREILFTEGAKGYYRSSAARSLSKRQDRQAAESGVRAAQLSCEHLLSTNSSSEARRACATTMKRVAYSLYPDHPDLSAQAERSAAALGGSDLELGGGWPTKLAAALLGWRLASRLQRLKRRFRSTD